MANDKTHKKKRYRRTNVSVKYVCESKDLDKKLKGDVKQKFCELFNNPKTSDDKMAWRMFYGNAKPKTFLQKFGINLDAPTVRDAVALDLVKVDNDSVSNDSDYTCKEHIKYSQMEYERYLLNKNFRINLVNLEPEWSKISYAGKSNDGEQAITKSKRTVERMYQGVIVSTTLMRFFRDLLNKKKAGFSLEGVYIPFTNANDFTTEVSLVPNTHPDFRPITARAYYDMKYAKYK